MIAGAVFDYGTLAGKAEGDPPPPEGTVNWVAWWDEDNGIPYEILTEDNTNCIDGEDLGYSKVIIPQMILSDGRYKLKIFYTNHQLIEINQFTWFLAAWEKIGQAQYGNTLFLAG